jgi:putative flavoprotein involved in K+ transport
LTHGPENQLQDFYQENRTMKYTDTVIIGGGQAGLAMSRCLHERGIDHVVLERGRIAERWRTERWDSLRLLSPNWMSRLPHFRYRGNDPDGFMTMPEFIRHLEAYADSFDAPVQSATDVENVRRAGAGFSVETSRGAWRARNVVVATGFCHVPRVPGFAAHLSPDIHQIVPSDYRNPAQLPTGNVLIVGASATGIQIAEELLNDGRSVTIAVGTHVRLPRRYRGKDILQWMVAMGAFAAPANPAEERNSPPPQLIGTADNRDLDLGTLQAQGARLVGRAVDAAGDHVTFADDLDETIAKADAGLVQLLAKIDGYIDANCDDPVPPAVPFRPIVARPAPTGLSLHEEGITSVVWSTGYERRYPWLQVPVLDARGEIAHENGVTAQPGLYVLGMRFQVSKGSNLIDGVGADAEALAEHLAAGNKARQAA